jgi:hypothetical protein
LPFLSILATTAAPLCLTGLASRQYRETVAGMYDTLYYIASAKEHMYRLLTWSRDNSLRLAQCTRGTFTFRLMAPQLASPFVAPDAMPRICGSRHLVLSRISSVVGDALMLTVKKLTSGRFIGKYQPVLYERRSKSLLRRSPDDRDVGIPSQRGHDFVEGFLRPPSAL